MGESSKRNRRALLGRLGERMAESFLEMTGHVILSRNLIVDRHEIDLLAREGDCLVLVEVRMRSGRSFGTSLDSMHPGKLRRLHSAMQRVQCRMHWNGEMRLDLITIDGCPEGGQLQLEHYRGIA